MIRKIQEKTGRNKKLHRKRQIKEMLKNQRKRAFGRSLKDMPKVLFICHGSIEKKAFADTFLDNLIVILLNIWYI